MLLCSQQAYVFIYRNTCVVDSGNTSSVFSVHVRSHLSSVDGEHVPLQHMIFREGLTTFVAVIVSLLQMHWLYVTLQHVALRKAPTAVLKRKINDILKKISAKFISVKRCIFYQTQLTSNLTGFSTTLPSTYNKQLKKDITLSQYSNKMLNIAKYRRTSLYARDRDQKILEERFSKKGWFSITCTQIRR